MSTETTASVSTHLLDTSVGRPARGVTVRLSARPGRGARWQELGGSQTDADGRCADLTALPEDTTHVRLHFDVEPYFTDRQAEAGRDAPAHREGGTKVFFPEVAIVFAVVPGEHYHVPLLLNPFGYSVYRGS